MPHSTENPPTRMPLELLAPAGEQAAYGAGAAVPRVGALRNMARGMTIDSLDMVVGGMLKAAEGFAATGARRSMRCEGRRAWSGKEQRPVWWVQGLPRARSK